MLSSTRRWRCWCDVTATHRGKLTPHILFRQAQRAVIGPNVSVPESDQRRHCCFENFTGALVAQLVFYLSHLHRRHLPPVECLFATDDVASE